MPEVTMRKKLHFELEFFRHKWPIVALGFVGGGREFVTCLWFVTLRIRWGY